MAGVSSRQSTLGDRSFENRRFTTLSELHSEEHSLSSLAKKNHTRENKSAPARTQTLRDTRNLLDAVGEKGFGAGKIEDTTVTGIFHHLAQNPSQAAVWRHLLVCPQNLPHEFLPFRVVGVWILPLSWCTIVLQKVQDVKKPVRCIVPIEKTSM